MDHTASVFLLNKEGNFEGTIAYREDGATAIAKLRKLLARG
jgi:protein SCO1/2